MNIAKDKVLKLEAMLAQFERTNTTVTEPAVESINGLCACGGGCSCNCGGNCKGSCHRWCAGNARP